MIRRVLLVAVALAFACGPRRSLDIEFTGPTPTAVDSIASVSVEVYNGSDCTCAQLDKKDGCMTTDVVSSLTFNPASANRSAGGFPDGTLAVRVTAQSSDGKTVPLRINCYCVADSAVPKTLVFPLTDASTQKPSSNAGCSDSPP